MGLQRIPYESFRGLNTLDGPYDLDPHEAQDCLNVQPVDQYRLKGLKQRAGRTAMFDVPASPDAANPVDGALYWRSKGLWLLTVAGDIIKCNTSGGSSSKLFDSANPGFWAMAVAEQAAATPLALFMPAHATDVPKYYDGGAFAAWPQPPQVGTSQTVMAVWKGRVVIGNTSGFPDRLWYGDPFAPLVANYQWITISDGGGAETSEGIRALVVHNDGHLYVFKERSIWQVYDPVTFANRLVARVGTPSRNGAASHPNGRLYFFSSVDKCLYSTAGVSGADRESDAVRPTLASIHPSFFQVVVSPSGSVLLSFKVTQQNDRLLELFPVGTPGSNPIFIHTLPGVSGTSLVTVGESATERDAVVVSYPVAGSAAKMATMFTGTSDEGSAIDSYWTIAWRSFLSEEPVERLRRLHCIYGGKPTIDVYSSDSPTDVSSLSPNATYALTEQASGRKFSLSRPESRGRYHCVKIRNSTLNKSFTVDKLEFAIRGGREHATGVGSAV